MEIQPLLNLYICVLPTALKFEKILLRFNRKVRGMVLRSLYLFTKPILTLQPELLKEGFGFYYVFSLLLA